MSSAWPAPYAGSPVRASVAVPGSKSQTARELVLSALASTPTRLRRPLVSRDSLLMVGALRALGTRVEEHPSGARDEWLVAPHAITGGTTIDCGLAGTVMRFLAPVAGLADGPVRFEGDTQALARPMAGLLDALSALGVAVDRPDEGSLPFTVTGRGDLEGGPVDVDAAPSSQFLSALLLSAPRFRRGLDVRVVGDLPSRPHVDMTTAALRARGVTVDEPSPERWVVAPGQVAGGTVDIEPDLSNAAPFLAAAAVTAGTVSVPGWPDASRQPGADMIRLLAAMGATVHHGRDELTLTGPQRLRGLGEVDMSHAGELVPTLAAVCALAEGETRIAGVAHLRGHETDRLAALATELGRVGADVRETADGLTIRPGPLHAARLQTYHDHRMATAAAIIGLRVPGVSVVDVETTAKTLPDFAALWTSMVQERR